MASKSGLSPQIALAPKHMFEQKNSIIGFELLPVAQPFGLECRVVARAAQHF